MKLNLYKKKTIFMIRIFNQYNKITGYFVSILTNLIPGRDRLFKNH